MTMRARAVFPELEAHVLGADAGAGPQHAGARADAGDADLLAGDDVDDHVRVELLLARVGRRRRRDGEGSGVRVAHGKRVGCIDRVERAEALERRGRGRERIVVGQDVGAPGIAIGTERRVPRVARRMVVGALPGPDGLGRVGGRDEAVRRVDGGRKVTVQRHGERDILASVGGDRLVEHGRRPRSLRHGGRRDQDEHER